MMNLPYSQCDAKGRCMRHPTIQMSRKKKLGGWKKLFELCPMCAMQLIANDNSDCDAAEYCGDNAVAPSMQQNGISPAAPSSRGHDDSYYADNARSAKAHHHRSRPHSGHHRHNSDDRSVDAKSVRSAPSTFHRRDSSEYGYSNDSSSCDTTDMSQSSSSEYSSPRDGSFRRSNSNGGGSVYSQNSHGSSRSQGQHSVRSTTSSHSSRSSSRRTDNPSSRNRNANSGIPNQEQFVCGMEYQGMFYTGQIHVDSRLPHGLGTLRRSDGNGNIWEGQWQFGRLVQESNPQAADVDESTTQEYQETQEEEYACKDFNDYCVPCSSNSPKSLCDNFQQCHIDESNDDTGSTSSSSWSRSSSCASNISSYSARESKSSLPPPPPPTNSRATYNKLQEYEQYVQQCDEEEDWYQDDDVNQSSTRNNGRGNSNPYYSPQCVGGMNYERPKKVRFREDP